jgi:hypothetical protein
MGVERRPLDGELRARRGLRAVVVLLSSALQSTALGGCDAHGLELRPLAVGPLDVFETQVQPVLEVRCAQGGCHGRPDRPFVLYAPGVYRRDPTRAGLDEPLDSVEISENALRVAALRDRVDVDRSPVLRKPLAGSSHHGGGVIFEARTEREYQVLRRWLLACADAEGGGI